MSDEKLRNLERSAQSPEDVERLEAERRRQGHGLRLDGKVTRDVAIFLGNRGWGELYHRTMKNADNSALRIRVNGKCQLWKTRPTDFRLPCKHGLRQFYQLTAVTADEWTTIEPSAFLPYSDRFIHRLVDGLPCSGITAEGLLEWLNRKPDSIGDSMLNENLSVRWAVAFGLWTYCNLYHSGQSSDLYSILCQIDITVRNELTADNDPEAHNVYTALGGA